jgi:hypothetical protein
VVRLRGVERLEGDPGGICEAARFELDDRLAGWRGVGASDPWVGCACGREERRRESGRLLNSNTGYLGDDAGSGKRI